MLCSHTTKQDGPLSLKIVMVPEDAIEASKGKAVNSPTQMQPYEPIVVQ